MGIGDLDSGARFGLPPIGLPESNLGTPGSDTERRAMPGLATKSSVFAWRNDTPTIISVVAVTGLHFDLVQLRNNTAPGGSSIDVPTWAAGAIIAFQYVPLSVNSHQWGINSGVPSPGLPGASLWGDQLNAIPPGAKTAQVIVPFYDEPTLYVFYQSVGTSTYSAILIGFVRNV